MHANPTAPPTGVSPEQIAPGRRPGRPTIFLIGGAVFAVVVILLALALGGQDLNLTDVIHGLALRAFGGVLTQDFSRSYTILWDLRLPRVLLAFTGGAALSISGVIMQGLLRNPLVSPFTLGISPAAAFGAAAVILVTGGTASGSPLLVIASALVFSLGCAALIMSLASLKSMSAAPLILLGIALTQLFTAMTAVLQYVADERTLAAMLRWTFGSVNEASWPQVGILSLALVIALPFLIYRAKDLNAIAFAGDDSAKSFGVDVNTTRTVLITVAVLLASLVVAFTGVIGFVGLVGPHIARMLIGSDHRALIPFSALSGGIMLILADLVGRIIFAPVVVPAGIVVAFLGSFLFIHLILRNKQAAQ